MKSADYCYGEITPTPPPTPFPTPAGWVSTRIEAVDYTDQVGMEFNPNPVPHLGLIEDGDYVTYNVNFNPSGTNYRINLLYSLKGSDDRDGGTLEARIGGPTGLIIGTFLPSPTSESSWDAFIEDTFDLTGEPFVGSQITFVARTERFLMNFGWFEMGYVEDLNVLTNSPTNQPTNQPTNVSM